MAVTESFHTNWQARDNWSSWLNEPIVPTGHNVTQINLIERVTVTKPGEGDERISLQDIRRHSSSSEERRKRRHRHRRSSSEGRTRDRHDRHSTGRIREFDPSPERRESRRRHEERMSMSHQIDDIGVDGERYQQRRHRSSSGDSRNKPLPPLPPHAEDRHTTGRLASQRQTSTDEWSKTRSLSAGDKRNYNDDEGMSSLKTTTSVGTSTHGQIFLQDGSPAPDFDSKRLSQLSQMSGTLDFNSNGMIRSGEDTISRDTPNGDHLTEPEKKLLDSRRSSEMSDIYFKQSPSCGIPSSLIYAVAVTLTCFWCFPVGVYAIRRALQVRPRRKAGDIMGAMKASKSAGFWATITLIWGALVLGAVLLLLILFTDFGN